jgi:hypothetical protein
MKKDIFLVFHALGECDEITRPKMDPCEEITSPLTKLPFLNKHLKKLKRK